VLAALLLSGCAPHMIYLRADGVNPTGDPVLKQQFDTDSTICEGVMQKANVAGPVTGSGGGELAAVVGVASHNEAVAQVGQGCMAEKGYVLVKEADAPAKSQELAAAAAEKARREAEAAAAATAAAAAARKPPKKIAAKHKPKPPQPSPPPATPTPSPPAH
jgi:hypothetical protein